MQEAISRYLDYLEHEKRYSPRTVQGYEQDLLKFAKYLNHKFGKDTPKLGLFSREVILAFLKRPLKSGEKPNPAYRNRRLAVLKSFAKYLVREGLLHANPTAAVEWAKVSPTDPEFLTHAEYLRIVATIEALHSEFYRARDLAIIATLYHTGLRLSELNCCNVATVDFENRLFVGVQRKGGAKKNLPVNGEVLDAVRLWLEQREKLRVKDEPALFLSDRKTRINPRSIQVLVAKYAFEAGLTKQVSPHTFRHSHCTEILNRGASIATAKELMNHASIKTTARYSHTTEDMMRAAVDSLAKPSQTEESVV